MESSKQAPTFTLVLGPPAAGKSFVSKLNKETPFFDRDIFLQKISGGQQHRFHDDQIQQAIDQRKNFISQHIIEHTNYGLHAQLKSLKDLNPCNQPRENGYLIRVDFICAGTLKEHLQRAHIRETKQRGHIVAPQELTKLYEANLRSLPMLFHLAAENQIDKLNIIDNSKRYTDPNIIVTIEKNKIAGVTKVQPPWIVSSLEHTPFSIERLRNASELKLNLSQLDQHRNERLAALAIPLKLPENIQYSSIATFRSTDTILADLHVARKRLAYGDPANIVAEHIRATTAALPDRSNEYTKELIQMVEEQIGPTQKFREYIDIRQLQGALFQPGSHTQNSELTANSVPITVSTNLRKGVNPMPTLEATKNANQPATSSRKTKAPKGPAAETTSDANSKRTSPSPQELGTNAGRSESGPATSTAKTEHAEAVKKELQALATSQNPTTKQVTKLLDAVGPLSPDASFKVIYRDPGMTKHVEYEAGRDDVIRKIGLLQAQNIQGANILIKPIGQHNVITLSGIDDSNLKQLMADTPIAASVRTGPNQSDVWLKVGDVPIDHATRHEAAILLAEKYGANTEHAMKSHAAALPGFTNKSIEPVDGKPTWTKLENSTGQKMQPELAQTLMEAAVGRVHEINESLIAGKTAAIKAIRESVNEPTVVSPSDPSKATTAYQQQAARIIGQYGKDAEFAKIDWMIATDMAAKGWQKQDIAKAIHDASPNIDPKRTDHMREYANKTAGKAYEIVERKAKEAEKAKDKPKEKSKDKGMQI